MGKTGTTVYVSAETMDIIRDVRMCMQADLGVKISQEAAIKVGMEIIQGIYLKKMAKQVAANPDPNYFVNAIKNAK